MAQTCCGQPAYNSGDRADTKDIARSTIALFEGFDYLVAPSGSCAGMIREHYPRLFEDEPAMHARAEHLRRNGPTSWSRSWSTSWAWWAWSPTMTARSPITIPAPACASWASRSSRAGC